MRHMSVKMPDDLANFFDREFPHGFKQAFVLRSMEKLRELIEDGKVPRHDIFAAEAVAGIIEEGD